MRAQFVKRGQAALVFTALLAACTTTPTPYQPLGAEGGYTSQQIENNRFRVSFVGNSLTSRERVENYLLYRAAELTLERGFNCFTTVNRDVQRDVTTRVIPYGVITGTGAITGAMPVGVRIGVSTVPMAGTATIPGWAAPSLPMTSTRSTIMRRRLRSS